MSEDEIQIYRLFDVVGQEQVYRILQARRRDPQCSLRQAGHRALAAAREARDLNRLL